MSERLLEARNYTLLIYVYHVSVAYSLVFPAYHMDTLILYNLATDRDIER